jgi:[ribosomal protein S5]-alanine N-acetyltransferase
MRLDCGPFDLRPWLLGDAEEFVRCANDPAVAANLCDSFPHPYTLAHATAWLRAAVAVWPVVEFAIEVDGEVAGGIGLTFGTDIHRCSAEIGYWLGRSFWGRGLATAAVKALVGYGFREFRPMRIFARVFAGHTASIRVLEKAGFSREGLMRRAAIKAGVVRDQVLYAITDEGGS